MSASKFLSDRRRLPLLDTTANYTNHRATPQANDSSKLPPKVQHPHHQSLRPGEVLVTANLGPVAERLPAISDETVGEQRRISHASVSSTSTSAARKLKTHVGPWQLGKSLGHGMSGKVRKARHTGTGLVAAVKIISIRQAARLQTASIMNIQAQSKIAPVTREDKMPMVLQREITILKTIEHPNIIRLLDVWENRGEIYMIMEFVEGGELFNYIKLQPLPEDEAARLFRQVISGLEYCHRFRLCHRDLKPENILLDKQGNIKLADFGMAAMHHGKFLKTACGSPHYAAPEVCQGDHYLGDLADIWSAGVVLYVMLFSELPFGRHCNADDIATIVNEVRKKPITFRDDVDVSIQAKDFLICILQRKPAKRMRISEMWVHPWLVAYQAIAARPQNKARWLGGPLPPLSEADCGQPVKELSQIDHDVIRGLCTLWQTDDQQRFVDALLDPNACYEKVLYNSLKRFRLEQEEHYLAPTLPSSTSDYHLVSSLKKSVTRSSLLLPTSCNRSKYSILPPSRRHPSTISKSSQPAPNRARPATAYDQQRCVNHRRSYRSTHYATFDGLETSPDVSKTFSTQASERLSRLAQESSVWETTIASSSHSRFIPSSPPVVRDDHGRLRTLRHTGTTKHALSSSSAISMTSRATSFSSMRFPKSSSFKRNVSFQRLRTQQSLYQRSPTPKGLGQMYLTQQRKYTEVVYSPGEMRNETTTETCSSEPVSTACVVANSPQYYCSERPEPEIRVSNELAHFCDEAFGPSPVPVASNGPKNLTANEVLAARLGSSGKLGKTQSPSKEHRERPLPEPPIQESYALQVQRDLCKMLVSLKVKERELGPGMLDEAMAEIERMMRLNAPKITEANYERRTVSTPMPKRDDGGNTILASSMAEYPVKGRSYGDDGRRFFSQQLSGPLYDRQPSKADYDGPTIRFVPKSPGISQLGMDKIVPTEKLTEAPRVPVTSTSRTKDIAVHKLGQDLTEVHDAFHIQRPATVGTNDRQLHVIEEDRDREFDGEHGCRHESSGNKFKSWFSKSNRSSKSLEKPKPTMLQSRTFYAGLGQISDASSTAAGTCGKRPDCRIRVWQDHVQPGRDNVKGNFQQPAIPSEYPDQVGENTGVPSSRGGFWSFLRRDKQGDLALIAASETESTIEQSVTSSQRCPPNGSRLTMPQESENNYPFPTLLPKQFSHQPQNWFARLLQVKPGYCTMAFDASRTRVMKEMKQILRERRRYGVTDILVEKRLGRIWARLDDSNALGAKSVEIMIEVFAVIYTAHRSCSSAGMSVARMEQIKGAKSSFDRCAAEMVRICNEKGIMVSDAGKAREMKKALKSWRR